MFDFLRKIWSGNAVSAAPPDSGYRSADMPAQEFPEAIGRAYWPDPTLTPTFIATPRFATSNPRIVFRGCENANRPQDIAKFFAFFDQLQDRHPEMRLFILGSSGANQMADFWRIQNRCEGRIIELEDENGVRVNGRDNREILYETFFGIDPDLVVVFSKSLEPEQTDNGCALTEGLAREAEAKDVIMIDLGW